MNRRRAFTLIELLVVIAIIAILGVLLLPALAAKNIVSFADGHVSYIKFFSDKNRFMATCFYNSPASYDYKWSGD